MFDATPLFRLYAKRRRAALERLDPARAQEAQLLSLLRAARDTTFGRAHSFANIASVADFQTRVPLRKYESIWDEWWRPAYPVLDNVTWPGRIPYFALSSGTSAGPSKFIPVSREMMASNRRAALDVLVHHVTAHPESRLLGGKSLVLGGSTALNEVAPGILAGDLSGIAAATTPRWAKSRYFPPRDLALIADWDEKIAALAPASLMEDIRSIAGTPSWLLLFFERLRDDRPARLAQYFPHLELIIHGGVGFAPYRARFDAWLKESSATLREVYPASEGFIALQDKAPADGLRLMLDNGIFYEFVPLDQLGAAHAERHWIANVKSGVNYALVLSTNAGLWSYIIGDTVEFVSLNPPRLRVTGRISYSLSAFGEHLTGEELDAAVAEAAAAIGATIADYTATVVAPDEKDARGGHLFFVEFTEPDARVDEFGRALDVALACLNDDYAAHRSGDFGMRAPAIAVLRPGAFADWMRARGRIGGQNKVPRVLHDPALVAGLHTSVTEKYK